MAFAVHGRAPHSVMVRFPRMPRGSVTLAIAVAGLVSLCVGCRTSGTAERAPLDVEAAVAPELARDAAREPEGDELVGGLLIEGRLFTTSRDNLREWPLASSMARLVAPGAGQRGLGAAVRLASAARVLRGDEAAAWLAAGNMESLPGRFDGVVTAELGARLEASLELGEGELPRVAVHLGDVGSAGTPEAPAVAVSLAVLDPEQDNWDAEERTLLESPLPPNEWLLAAWPTDGGRSLVLATRLLPAPGPDADAVLVERYREFAAESRARALLERDKERALERVLDPAEGEILALARALDAAARGGERRPAAVYLTSPSHTPLAADWVLVAEPERLGTWIAALVAGASEGVEGNDAAARLSQMHWRIERRTWITLAEAAQEGQASPAERGLLLHHAGEAGHGPGRLRDVALEAADRAQFEAALESENRQLLEDASPAARARAHHWLQTRGKAVTGFDPFGDTEARRAALTAAGGGGA